MFRFLKKILAQDRDQAARDFKTKYLHFRELLDRNNEVLETLSALVDFRDQQQTIGLGRLRSMLTRVVVNVYRLIENLNFITDDRYLVLNDTFNRLEEKITSGLRVPIEPGLKEWCLPLEEVDRKLAPEVGTKSANLGEISRAGVAAVPRGAAFTFYAYHRFFEHNRLQERINKEGLALDPDDYDNIEKTSGRIREMIMSASLPPGLEESLHQAYRRVIGDCSSGTALVVRSSAVGEDEPGSSFAGLFSSLLNPAPQDLAGAYKEVVAGKYSPRAITYCLQKGLYEEFLPMCVLLMALV
ncbi:MAG: PEP/pyruvate-binding domain-containing protein, partial [Thermodesulfobacteriota bacterium]